MPEFTILQGLEEDRNKLRMKRLKGTMTEEDHDLLTDIEDIISSYQTKIRRKSIRGRHRSENDHNVREIFSTYKEERRKALAQAKAKEHKAKLTRDFLRMVKLDIDRKITNPLFDLNESKSETARDIVEYLLGSNDEERISVIDSLNNQQYKKVSKKLSKRINHKENEIDEVILVLR